MTKPCRHPDCTSTYAGEHTWHNAPAWIANWRTGEVIRRVTIAEVRAARRAPGGEWLVGDTAYIVRVLDDECQTVIPLTDDDITAILEGK